MFCELMGIFSFLFCDIILIIDSVRIFNKLLFVKIILIKSCSLFNAGNVFPIMLKKVWGRLYLCFPDFFSGNSNMIAFAMDTDSLVHTDSLSFKIVTIATYRTSFRVFTKLGQMSIPEAPETLPEGCRAVPAVFTS